MFSELLPTAKASRLPACHFHHVPSSHAGTSASNTGLPSNCPLSPPTPSTQEISKLQEKHKYHPQVGISALEKHDKQEVMRTMDRPCCKHLRVGGMHVCSEQGHTHDSPWWVVSRVGKEQRGLHRWCGAMSCHHVPFITSILDSPKVLKPSS